MRKDLHTRFIVLCTARTGSNFLTSLLRKHMNVAMHGEIFNLDVLGEQQLKRVLQDPLQYMSDCFDFGNCPEETRAVGFKLFYDHLTLEVFKTFHSYKRMIELFSNTAKERYSRILYDRIEKTWKYLLDENNIRIIHLKRNNKFDTFVSLKTALMTNQWMEYENQTSGNTYMKIQPDECSHFFKQIDFYEKFYADMFKKHPILEVNYERLVMDKDTVIREVFDFLEVSPVPVHVAMKKQMKYPLNEVVHNYCDLKQHFLNTPWSSYFTL